MDNRPIFVQNSVLSHFNDTELLETALQNIMEYVPAHIYWKDRAGKYLGCNETQTINLGFNRSSEVVGKTDFELPWPTGFAEEFRRNDFEVMKTGVIKVAEEKSIMSGKDVIVLSQKVPLKNKQGNIIGLLGISLDITAQKQAETLKLENQTKIYNTRIEEQEKFRAIAAQVAHDIGSPLAALQMVIPHCDILPETTRKVLSKSATRIADIAENFLSQFKPKDEPSSIESIRTPTLISTELLEILTEKKYEYSQSSVDFISNISQSGAFAFINIDSGAFKRMISNLINNAVDAFNGDIGQVTIDLSTIDNQVQITVEDNGKGIPEAVKEKLLNNIQVTAGKENGHGIGYTQIRETLYNNEGMFHIESQENVGTKIILTFPRVSTPDWMAESIKLNDDDLIVILDDDDSIHGAWETRFGKSVPDIKIHHFKQGDEVVHFINGLSPQEKQKVFLLTDYELLHQGLHGLDVIDKTGIKRSILVTSYHNNPVMREKTRLTITKILPKSLASVIQIKVTKNVDSQQITQHKSIDLVILDDDVELVNIIFMCIVQKNNLVDKYHKPEDLLNNLAQYPKDTNFLIDNQYKGEQIRGIDICQQLYELGYSNLYLFTSEVFADTTLPDYIKIIAKDDIQAVTKLLVRDV